MPKLGPYITIAALLKKFDGLADSTVRTWIRKGKIVPFQNPATDKRAIPIALPTERAIELAEKTMSNGSHLRAKERRNREYAA